MSYKQIQKNQRETVREEWLNGFQRKTDFDGWIDHHTKGRKFVAVHAGDVEGDWQDTLYSGCCDPKIEPVRLGCEKYWKMYAKPKEKAAPTAAGGPAGPSFDQLLEDPRAFHSQAALRSFF